MYAPLMHNSRPVARTKCRAFREELVRLAAVPGGEYCCQLCGPKMMQVTSRRFMGLPSTFTCSNSLIYYKATVIRDCNDLAANRYNSLVNYKSKLIRDCDSLKSITGPVLWRSFHSSHILLGCEPLKPSSKVEETVTVLKEKVKEQAEAAGSAAADKPGAVVGVGTATVTAVQPKKKNWKQKIVAELVHYYHGFRLLFIDINVSRKLFWRVLQGYTLTRREHKLLIRTVGDLFRLVPFSVFIIVPFMEFLLPFFIKFFPGMLPSTFQTTSEKEDKMKQALKVKLEMAKFLQRTLDEMAVAGKGHSSQSAKEFAQFFEKIRTSGEMTTSEEIMKFSKLFEDEITLDSLPRPQLMALCRVLEMNPIGTTNFLRFQLRLKLRSLIADDKMIQREGVDSLSQAELQAACRSRGMRALGVSEQRLKAQLTQWLDLSLVKKVPPSLLLLSQAFMLPETTTTSEKLAATISALPDVVGTQTKAVIGEREGKVDNKTKIELIKEEMTKIKEERKEQQEEEAKLKLKEEGEKKEEIMVDPAPTLVDKSMMMEPALRAVLQDIKKTSISERIADSDLTTKDLEALEQALDALGKDQNRLLVEQKELQELRQEMAEYQEDIADLQKVTSSAGKELEVKESRAAQLLFRRVNKMISKMDNVLSKLEKKESKEMLIDEPQVSPASTASDESVSMLRIDDLIAAIHKLEKEPNSARLERLAEVLGKLDGDRDGIVKMETLFKVIEMIGHEKVKLSKKQIDELLALIHKEEAIELDDQIIKALRKKDEQDEEKAGVADKTKDVSKTSSKGSGKSPEPPSKKENIETAEKAKDSNKNGPERGGQAMCSKVKEATSSDGDETIVLSIREDSSAENKMADEPVAGESVKDNLTSTISPPPPILEHKPPNSIQQPKELR